MEAAPEKNRYIHGGSQLDAPVTHASGLERFVVGFQLPLTPVTVWPEKFRRRQSCVAGGWSTLPPPTPHDCWKKMLPASFFQPCFFVLCFLFGFSLFLFPFSFCSWVLAIRFACVSCFVFCCFIILCLLRVSL